MKASIFNFLLLLVVAAAPGAQGSLGGDSGSVNADVASLGGTAHPPVNFALYSVQEFEAGGTVVREYLTPAGLVFGVAWVGLTHPDFNILLGTYATEYGKELKHSPHHKGRHPHHIHATHVVVQKSGHQRKLMGRAYLPNSLPVGVSADDIH